jgi:site-specific DNA recombinase
MRVSTHEQAEERHVSLKAQRARISGWCGEHDYALVGEFIDVLSGRRGDRKDYRRMVELLLRGDADAVVVQFLDRFGRVPKEILTRIWELEEHNVKVIATDEDIGEELVLLVRAGLAGAESRRTSERVRSYMAHSAATGIHFGRIPYGYHRDVVNGEAIWSQEPAEAAIVRDMARLAVDENLGYKSIATILTRQGVRTREGQPWSAPSIRHILTNPATRGTLVYGRRPVKGNPTREPVEVPDFLPAILSADEWDRLQERLVIRRESARGRTHASDYLLSGIARCGHCGGPLIGKVGGLRRHKDAAPGERYRNYWCSRAMQTGHCDVYNGHSSRKLEQAILGKLAEYGDPERVRELLDQDATPSASDDLASQLVMIERRLAELDADFHRDLDRMNRGIFDEEDFARANATRKDERRALEERQADLRKKISDASAQDERARMLPVRVRSFLEDVEEMETRKAKAVLQTILKAAHTYNDGRIELEFR